MAMNVGEADDEIIGAINTTPLVDVMPVLLIIFLITIPVVTTSIKVDLPKEKNVIRETKPENVIISVDRAGGIYHALVKIGMSGQASIDKVAGPVGEALIMTAIGLAVAVPAVLGYNFLVRRNKAVMEQVNAFGSDLHAVLLGSAKK